MLETQYIKYEVGCSEKDLNLLRIFYHSVYVNEFPDPDERESLDNMMNYLCLKANGWYGDNNYHILLMLEGEQPIAASITDYFAEANTGVIEFLLVTPPFRGRGVAKQLIEYTEITLQADAKKLGNYDLDLIVGEMNDPFKSGNVEDNIDPFVRARIWHNWGYRKLNFPYVQPALSTAQDPVYNLLLMGKVSNAAFEKGIPASLIKVIVHEYLRWAMRIENPDNCSEYQNMCRYLDTVETVTTTLLSNYVGYEETRPLLVQEIYDHDDPDLEAVLNVYRSIFKPGPTTALSEDFIQALSAAMSNDERFNYHLWGLRSSFKGKIEGMASFFTFTNAGFGGYLALTEALKGGGRLRLLLARIEAQMLKDCRDCSGWLIECEPRGQELIFEHVGFHKIAMTYRQPPMNGQPLYDLADAPILHLMYKDFGCQYSEPKLSCEKFLNAVEWIYRIVYDIEIPINSIFFQDVKNQTLVFTNGFLAFQTSKSIRLV